MNVPAVHNFCERLAFSEGIEDGDEVLSAIARMVPNADQVIRASQDDDKQGTDYWITRTHGLPALSIDVKRRSYCPIEKFNKDDACIETTSVYRGAGPPWVTERREKVGWTLDYSKRTDFIVYTWPNQDRTRFWILPFVPLCQAARINWRSWVNTYKEIPAANYNYQTLCVYPSRQEITQAMNVIMCNTV